ncbi:MAG: DUF6603 domain-containing protein [Gemmatimonadota bacterium]
MTVTLPEDALDPVVRKIGEVAGFLTDGAAPQVSDAFLADPLKTLAGALSDRQDAIIELLGMLLGDTNAEVLGMPAGGTEDHWIPIRDLDGNETGLYLVVSSKEGRFHVGLGWRFDTIEGDVTVSVWAHIPLLSTNGTTVSDGTRLDIATEAAPVRIAAEVTLAGGFGLDGLRFRGVRGMIAVKGFTAPPDVGLVLLGLEMGGAAPADRSLADLASLPATAWIDTAVALFTAQLQQAGAGNVASLVAQYVLPLAGITAPGAMPRLKWEELPTRGVAVFDEWFNALVSTPAAMQQWLGKWQGLLNSATVTPVSVPAGGSGTRADPWRAGVRLPGIPVIIEPTAAVESLGSGARLLYLGLRVRSTPIDLTGGANPAQLDITADAEIVAIPIGSAAPVRALPSLSAMLRITAQNGTLATHTFTSPDPLAALGTLRVGSIEAGLRLDASGNPDPHLALRNVACARGTWAMLDLTSADAILDGLGAVASNLIQQQIEQGLALATGGSHAGKRVASLLGLLAPTAGGAPASWPVPLATDATRITEFLGNPLGAVARYHAAALTTDIGGQPAWRFLLAELGELLREAGAPATSVIGTGALATPWRLVISRTDIGDVLLRGTLVLDGGRPQLRLTAALEPRALDVGDADLTLCVNAELLHLDLAPASTATGSRGSWLPGMEAALQLSRAGGLQTPSLAGLRIGANALAVALRWSPAGGATWSARVVQPVASWEGARAATLQLPPLELTPQGLPAWTLTDANLGGALGTVQRDAVAELSRFVIGHVALEHGGPVGFAMSALLGLLPGDPGIELPSRIDASLDLRLPPDFPVLQPANWAAFFADPWPEIRAHLLRLLADPQFTMPLLRWLATALQGLAPQRTRSGEVLTFAEAIGDAGRFTPPGTADDDEDADAPLAFPSLERLPIDVRGDGTYASPYRIGVRAAALRGVDALVWLDPDGPPSGAAIDVALQVLTPALRDLTRLDGVPLEQLLSILGALGRVDEGIARALEGVTPANLATALNQLETFLTTSDGVALTASQQPTDASWTKPAALEAAHVAQLSTASVIAAVQAQLTTWDAGQNPPVLLLAAPFERNDAWSAFSTALGSAPVTFSYRVGGVSPHGVSVRTLGGTARLTAAELAVYDDAPGLSAAARLVAVDAGAGSSSQAEQVVRLVERLREVQPTKQVIIVAHSSSGLAARAAVQRAGMAAHVRGVITIGTPHVGTPMAWLVDPTLRDAVSALQRLTDTVGAASPVKPALDALWQFLRGRDLTGQPLPWPAHAFAPSGSDALPAGVGGLAIATRLPGTRLRQEVASGIAARATQLRTALSSRAPVQQVGFGIGLAPRLTSADATLRVECTLRVDLVQMRVASGGTPRTLPQFVLHAKLSRADGWLVGAPADAVRVRWAELGLTIGADRVTPHVSLHDVSVNGVEQLLATVRETATGALQPDDLLVPALDALLARLTTAPGANADVVALAELLQSLDITKRRGATVAEGWALNPDGWLGAMADAKAYGQRVLADVLADAGRRAALLARLRTAFGFGATDLTRLLFDDAGDPPQWRALRAFLRGIGLLDSAARGSAPRMADLLALVASPAEFLRTRVQVLVRDAARRTELLTELRAILGVSDLTLPAAEHALGGGLRLRVEALGRVSLLIDDAAPITLGGALALQGRFDLDLRAGSATLALRIQPTGITTGLTWRATTNGAPLAWHLALDFGDGVRVAPLDALQVYPVPADFAQRLGALLPRVTVSTIATALLDSLVLPRLPELGTPLEYLGLAQRTTGGRHRIRNLSRLIADPLGWMRSAQTLGTATGELDATRLAGLVRELMTALRLSDSSGAVQLPFGLRLQTAISPAALVSLTMDTPLDLGAGVTIGADFALSWTAAGVLGTAGSLDLRAPLPGAWSAFRAQVGVENNAFRIALGADDAMIQLLPFAGFDAAALGTAAVNRLLPVLIDATLQALDADAATTSLVTRIRTAATVLEVDTIARLDDLRRDPIVWLRTRFSSVNAVATVTAVQAVIADAAFTVGASGKLVFRPGTSPVAITLGRNGSIGLGVEVMALDLGPVTMSATFKVGIGDTGAVEPIVTSTIDLRVDDGVIAPAGVSITPSLHFALNSGTGVVLQVYPIGNDPGSPDFLLDILPTFRFGVDDGGTIPDALLTLARRVLVPVVLETFLDTPDVTQWLKTSLVTPANAALQPGTILVNAGLLVPDGPAGFNLVPLDVLADPIRLVEGLIGAALGAAAGAFATTPLIKFADAEEPGDDDPGLYIVQKPAAPGPGEPRRYGVRVLLPELQVSDDPEIIIRLGGRSDWIEAAGGPAGTRAGLSFYAIRDNGASENPRYAFDPSFTIAGVGVHISGRVDEPLFDLDGFQLGGLEALLYLNVESIASGAPDVEFGLFGDIIDVAIPLGTSDSNPVAGSLMSGSGGDGDSEPVNPKFSVRAAYVDQLWVEIGGEERNEVWFPIQRTFGPVTIQQIGVRWIGGDNSELAVLLDGGVALAGLAVGVDDLSLTLPLAHISEISLWKLGLRGLAISYNGGGVKLAGGMLQASDEIRYDGFILVEVGGKSFVAFGSYGVVDGDTSLFVFLVVGIPIGGPPYFFITGLAGGFGYNRGLVVPPIEGVPQFPLVSAMSNPSAVTDDPMGFLRGLGPSFPMERGSYWFAAGIKFTSFTLVNSQALLYVLLNRGLEIGILGMSQAQLPPAPAPALVSIELAIKARFSTIEGLISVEARLTDNSWLLSRDCRLTGGFAFFLWFAGEHAGDFVITVGGYHPRFTKPAHYPDVPRLGFCWRIGSAITIKGEAYFALTPREMMAGGLLEASYDSGDISAWFRVWANAYIMWKPFWFEFDGGISIGVKVDTWLGTVRVEVGASFWIWGPSIGGEATVDLWIVSFTIEFGAAYNKPQPKLSWDEFRRTLLPPEDDKLFSGNVERGLISGSPARGPWLVLPEFILRSDVFIATSGVRFGGSATATTTFADKGEVDVRPMQVANVRSLHIVRVIRVRDGIDVTHRFQQREELGGNVARALWDTNTGNPSDTVIPALNGTRLVAEFDTTQLDSTGRIPWTKLFDEGRRHPLPFARELLDRVTIDPSARRAFELDAKALHAGSALLAADMVLRADVWAERRNATLEALSDEGVRVSAKQAQGDTTPRGTFRRGRRSSPPLVRSLYEGLNAEPVKEAERDVVPAPAPQPVRKVKIRPELESIIRQPVEATRASARAVRTTVSARQAAGARRDVDMQALLAAPIPGASVLMQAARTSVRESSVAVRMRRVSRGVEATARDTALLATLTKASRAREVPIGSTTHLDSRGVGGVPLDAGSTLRWTLPTRNTDGKPPMLHVRGDAAVRITALDRSGEPLMDVECVGTLSAVVPEGSATLIVTGLGLSQERKVVPAPGAVTLREATSPVPVVGWQSHMTLIIGDANTLLARGALVRLSAPLPERLQTGTILASTAIDSQNAVETILPVAVRAIAVVLDDRDDLSGGDLADTLAISARGASLADDPIVVSAGSRTILLYDVIATDADTATIAVPVAYSDAWSLNGVLGLSASAKEWATLLTTADLDTLVENGPLTPVGSSLLRFSDNS